MKKLQFFLATSILLACNTALFSMQGSRKYILTPALQRWIQEDNSSVPSQKEPYRLSKEKENNYDKIEKTIHYPQVNLKPHTPSKKLSINLEPRITAEKLQKKSTKDRRNFTDYCNAKIPNYKQNFPELTPQTQNETKKAKKLRINQILTERAKTK